MRHHTAPRSVACHGASMAHVKRIIPPATVQVKHLGLFGGVVHGIELNRNKSDWDFENRSGIH